jgi:quinol monooxygenase YgiN
MITRIVKMTFQVDQVDTFLDLFNEYKQAIRNQPGCLSLELLVEENGCVCFTFSRWSDEEALNNYRKSATFSTVWPQTKALFSAPAEAWTTRGFEVQ